MMMSQQRFAEIQKNRHRILSLSRAPSCRFFVWMVFFGSCWFTFFMRLPRWVFLAFCVRAVCLLPTSSSPAESGRRSVRDTSDAHTISSILATHSFRARETSRGISTTSITSHDHPARTTPPAAASPTLPPAFAEGIDRKSKKER